MNTFVDDVCELHQVVEANRMMGWRVMHGLAINIAAVFFIASLFAPLLFGWAGDGEYSGWFLVLSVGILIAVYELLKRILPRE